MIRVDHKRGITYLVHGTDAERAELDAKLERVEGQADTWKNRRGYRGLGDLVAVVAEPVARVLGVRKCGGCEKRQEALNKLVPFSSPDPSKL